MFLRALTPFYLYGAAVHVANLVSLSPAVEGIDTPAHWAAADVVYLSLDLAMVAGVWLGRWWGTAAFLIAAISQLLLYTLVPDAFALTPDHVAALRWLVAFHLICLGAFGLTVMAARVSRQPPPPAPRSE